MSSWTHERAKVAALTRSRTPDDPELVDARRNLRAARLADHIKAQVDAWPPLSTEQRHRLAALLRSPGAPPGAPGSAEPRVEQISAESETELSTRTGGGAHV